MGRFGLQFANPRRSPFSPVPHLHVDTCPILHHFRPLYLENLPGRLGGYVLCSSFNKAFQCRGPTFCLILASPGRLLLWICVSLSRQAVRVWPRP